MTTKFCKDVLVLLSGGIDSITCATYLLNQGFNVKALTFLSNNKIFSNFKEVFCAKEFARSKSLDHIILDVSNLDVLVNDIGNMRFSIGGKLGGCIPEYQQASPMSVEIMHMSSMMYAISHNISEIYWAIHKDDLGGDSPDKIIKYLGTINSLSEINYGVSCKVKTPFLYMSKSQVIDIGVDLGVEMNKTYSCSVGDDDPCGKCDQCKLREIALFKAVKRKIAI